MTNIQIEKTFQHINKYWKEDYYKTCHYEWLQIQLFISSKPTNYQCGRCATYWTKVTFINDHYNICPKCDTYLQPFLCNPINYKSVLRYIDIKWHEYILPNNLLYCKRCYETDLPRENYCEYCENSMCESCLDSQYEISFCKCEMCDRQ